MKSVIYKYSIEAKTQVVQEIKIPYSATFLKLDVQGNKIVAWYLVDLEEDNSVSLERKILAVWTGKEFDHDWNDDYLGTVQTPEGLVWHIFDQTDRE
jgi:hypothetical protein